MATEAADSTRTDEKPTELHRSIGPRMLLLFIVGDILGAGIYALTGKVAGEVGGALWVPFLIAFTLAALTATAYAELVGKYPRAAGAALYANRAFRRPFVTFLVAFAVMASGITSAAAAARAFGGKYLEEFISLPTAAVAVGFLLVLAAINFRGVQESVRVNLVLTMIELSGLIVIICIGAWVLLQGEGDPGRAMTFDSGTEKLWVGLLAGSALAFYALLGFEDSVNMCEEAHAPAKNYPKALFLGLGLTGLVYLAVAFVSSMVVPTEQLSKSTGPLLEVVKTADVSFPPKLFALIALLAVSNTALINMLMASRLVYGMANEGIVPSKFGEVHGTRRSPWFAILFTTALGIALVVTGDLSDLADTTVLLLLLVFATVNVAVLLLRRETVEHDHFRAPAAFPVLGAVASLILASPLTGRDADIYLRAAILLAIGVGFWVLNRVVHGKVDARSDADSQPAKV